MESAAIVDARDLVSLQRLRELVAIARASATRGLEAAASCVPGGGVGLFARRAYAVGEVMAEYTGRLQTPDETKRLYGGDEALAAYALTSRHGRTVDAAVGGGPEGARPLAMFANDALGDAHSPLRRAFDLPESNPYHAREPAEHRRRCAAYRADSGIDASAATGIGAASGLGTARGARNAEFRTLFARRSVLLRAGVRRGRPVRVSLWRSDATGAGADIAGAVRAREGPGTNVDLHDFVLSPRTYAPGVHALPVDRVFLVATRAVAPGDEVLVDYGHEYWQSPTAMLGLRTVQALLALGAVDAASSVTVDQVLDVVYPEALALLRGPRWDADFRALLTTPGRVANPIVSGNRPGTPLRMFNGYVVWMLQRRESHAAARIRPVPYLNALLTGPRERAPPRDRAHPPNQVVVDHLYVTRAPNGHDGSVAHAPLAWDRVVPFGPVRRPTPAAHPAWDAPVRRQLRVHVKLAEPGPDGRTQPDPARSPNSLRPHIADSLQPRVADSLQPRVAYSLQPRVADSLQPRVAGPEAVARQLARSHADALARLAQANRALVRATSSARSLLHRLRR